MPKKSLWTSCKQWVKREGRVLLVSSAVAGGVIALRLSGLLQSWEWATLDQMSRLRPPEQTNQQIVIVEISETDLRRLGQWPVPDAVMARLLQKINAYQPRTIGLDIYRDLPVGSGYGELEKAFAIIPNLIGIERLEDPPKNTGVDPPRVLSQKNQVGFNNIVIDADGKVRRSLLYWYVDGKAHQSFALKLALAYLRPEGITSKVAKIDAEHEYLQLGKSVFRRFEENDGGYVRANAGAYQILANFHRHSSGFPTISMTEVLADRVPANLMRDRVVLIGSRASSQDDLFYTPLSSSLLTTRPIIGVELHANFICHILTAARQGEPIINSLPDLVEGLLILSCSWLGATICWRLRVPRKSAIAVFLMGASMTVGCYLAFLASWWLPLIPFLLAMSGSTVLIVAYIAHLEEELKRSKEFLQKVINTIADPIFVKNKQHRSIILNQAYCKFIGQSLETLINKSDREVFSQKEAEVFWNQDELVFLTGEEQEHEEEFTDGRGNTHLIATKRSLHQDAAGNLFLVGVIRDITERKRIEEALKRTAADLTRSNEELKLSEDRLRYQASHDPLTSLPNRKQFYEFLSQSLEWGRANDRLVALLFLDLDGFKQVNDTMGHGMGDNLLKAVAGRLTGCLRGGDTVSRLGGDEFTVILSGIPKPEDAARVAQKILDTLSQVFLLDDSPIFVTGSIGISIYPLNGKTVEDLIKNADTAMYCAKNLGRNRYEFSDTLL